jgi:sulfoquinovosidase
VPPAGFRDRPDSTYFPMPWLLSTRGYGVLLDQDETSNFRLGSDAKDAWSMEVAAPRLAFRVFAGPKPADVVRRLSARLGRQPAPDAPFFLGPWYQPRRGTEDAEREELLAKDVPSSVAQTYTHYLPCGDQVGKDQKARIGRFHDAGMAITTYFNPMICTTYQPVYDQAKAAGALQTNAAGQAYEYKYTGSTIFFVAQFDFFAPAGRAFYKRLLDEAMADGYDGWMEDFGEYTPDDARSADGRTGSALHNDYVRGYHCAAYDAVRQQQRPIARFQRSGWTGVAPCAQLVWGGDPTTDWGFDGLSSAITQALTLGFSGISRWGSDIGGYFSLLGHKLSPELFKRWIQLGAVSGIMRTQANGFAVPGYTRPQLSDPEILPTWRRYAKLRTQLYPYIAAADGAYRASGLPVMRHLALVYPDDPKAVATDDEFLFGPDLLAAPVVEEGATKRSLYVPRGGWVDLWRTVKYDTRTGGLTLGRATTLAGSRTVELPAPLDELPLLARRGTVLPLLVPDVDTLAGYGDGKRQVRLADRAGRLDLLAFPYGRITTKLADGSRLVSRDRGDRWVLSVSAKRSTTFRLQASLGTLKKPFVPCAVSFAGKALARSAWSYRDSTRALTARFAGRKGRLVVSACRE